MDEFLIGLFAFVVLSFAGVGLVATVADVRYFDTISEQCVKQGFIQNKTTRITCSLENK